MPHTPESILANARQFMESRVLLTGAQLDLFTILSGEPLTAEQVTGRISGDARATTILLDALSATGYLRKESGRYSTAPDARCLVRDEPGSVLPMMMHSVHLWERWSNLTRIVQPNPPAEDDQMVWTRAFIGAMHVVASQTAGAVAEAVEPESAERLLDVGGGPGTYTIAFLKAAPQLKATLFDRPEVTQMARKWVEEAGLLDRVTFAPGDFYQDPLPGGHDLALVSAIIHQNSRQQNVDLYRKVFDALIPRGRLVIRDHVMSADRTQPPAGAMFAVNMLVGTAGGNCYTLEEIREDLESAGFHRVRQIQSGDRMDSLLEAFKA